MNNCAAGIFGLEIVLQIEEFEQIVSVVYRQMRRIGVKWSLGFGADTVGKMSFFWEIRSHLHRLAKRDENRLLFDYQHEIAAKFGYVRVDGQPKNFAVEQFMKRYYRTAQQVSTLNEMLLAYFSESVVTPRLPDYERQIIDINEYFKIVDGKLAVQHHKVFAEHPSAILELFYLLANHSEINGIRARTLRLLVLAAKRIDQRFRDNPEHQALFMSIIRSPHLYDTMVAMKRYGVLGN